MLSEKIKTILYANFDCRCLIQNEKGEFEGFDSVSKVADQIISALAETTDAEEGLTDEELNKIWNGLPDGAKCRDCRRALPDAATLKSRAIFAAKLAQAEKGKQEAAEAGVYS